MMQASTTLRWKSKHFSMSKFILGNFVENCQAFLWSKDSWVGIRSAINNNLCDLHAWNKVKQRKMQIASSMCNIVSHFLLLFGYFACLHSQQYPIAQWDNFRHWTTVAYSTVTLKHSKKLMHVKCTYVNDLYVRVMKYICCNFSRVQQINCLPPETAERPFEIFYILSILTGIQG